MAKGDTIGNPQLMTEEERNKAFGIEPEEEKKEEKKGATANVDGKKKIFNEKTKKWEDKKQWQKK